MTINKRKFAQATLAVLLLLQLARLSAAQSLEQQSIPSPQREATAEPDKGLSQLEQLRKKVDQLEALIERQNQTLIEMQRQLQDVKSEHLSASRPVTIQPINASLTTEPVAAQKTQSPNAAEGSPPTQANAQKMSGVLAGWDGNHAFLRSADGDFETNLTGYAQLDFRGYQHGNHPANTFLLRRARLALEGKLFRYFEYKVEGDFADTTSTVARDIYLKVHRVDHAQLTF
ncbi:MAG TPA: porin, partial [Pyrinomonadaceae bacterium]|nr:porin [Pyrinomonadaceae bacterium]